MGPTIYPRWVDDGLRSLAERRQVFHVLAETPCPYLSGRLERKLLTEIDGPAPAQDYSLLSRAGFRRSHRFAYRPACRDCSACVPVRVDVRRFKQTRSLRRVAQANADLVVQQRRARASDEQFELFRRYLLSRHADGEMASMTPLDYRAMIEDTRLPTRVAEFRTDDRRLLAACLVDWLDDGPSAVYSYFEPEESSRSPGSYMVLWLIEEAARRSLPYVYLGYWIAESPKMRYKARFRPLQGLGPDGWRDLGPE